MFMLLIINVIIFHLLVDFLFLFLFSAPSKGQRIGGVFLQFALLLEKIILKYCSDHPKAVTVIEKHKYVLI